MTSKVTQVGTRLKGMTVTHAGDLSMGLDKFVKMVEEQGGFYQRAANGNHLIVHGDDTGDKVYRAKQSNPQILVWPEDAFISMMRGSHIPIMKNPTALRDHTPEPNMTYGAVAPNKLPESYGDF